MPKSFSASPWKAFRDGSNWVIVAKGNAVIARLEGKANDEKTAKLIAAAPYALNALKAVMNLAGDEDLPDNGEWSGAAITDQVSAAIELSAGRN